MSKSTIAKKPASPPRSTLSANGKVRYAPSTAGSVTTTPVSDGAAHAFARIPVYPRGGGVEQELINALHSAPTASGSGFDHERAGKSTDGGFPLPPERRSALENRLGYSLDTVRMHPNSRRAATLTARAYTFGNHIHVSPRYTPIDDRLLTHEVVHVVQQAEGRAAGLGGYGALDTRPGLRAALETEARSAADRFRDDRRLSRPAGPLRPLPQSPAPPAIQQFDLEDDIRSELHRMPSPDREDLSEDESRARLRPIHERRERLRTLFRGMSRAEAIRFRSRLARRVRGDALSQRFHDMLATETRSELLAILDDIAAREPQDSPEPDRPEHPPAASHAERAGRRPDRVIPLPAHRERNPLELRGPDNGTCAVLAGDFRWLIEPQAGRSGSGGLAHARIEFVPRRVPEGLTVAFVQTVSTVEPEGGRGLSRRSAGEPEVEAGRRDTEPYYGADWDPERGRWVNEPNATQARPGDYAGEETPREGSRFAVAASPDVPLEFRQSAVINDSPMLLNGYEKHFETVAMVIETGQVLGSLRWGVARLQPRRGMPYYTYLSSATCSETATDDFRQSLDQFYASRTSTR